MNKENKDILEDARKRMRMARDVEQPHIERAEQDLRFLTGEGQWPEDERAAREAEGKPSLVYNALPQFVRKITGQVRQMNPAVKVSAGDNSASKEVAEIYEGLIREIEYRCDAASVYEGATESAVQCGIGHFRIRTDYVGHTTFDQHILIERIHNPFAVYYDITAKKPDRSDAQWVFIADQYLVDDFKAKWPKATLAEFDDVKAPLWWQDWRGGETVTVAEYYWIEYEEYDLALTSMGNVIRGPFPAGVEIAKKRKVRKPKVMWARLSGDEVLEGPQRVAGSYIPVIAVTGEELHIGEEVYRSGAIRFAKDAQVTYNVMRTASVETTMLQPRAPYLVTAKQVAGLETFWNEAHRANRPYLPYNVDEKAPPPNRVPPPVASQALVSEAQIAAEDMKRTIGIYDASLGARSNETSGVAIQSRQREAEIATSVYSDNMAKAVAHAGRVIVSMIPEVYDAERVVRVLGEDAQEKLVEINKRVPVATVGLTGPSVEYTVENDLTVGEYAVRISVGPAYTTKKQESAANMMDFMQRIPNVAPIIADLIAGAQEWPDSERIADRLRKTVPPQLLEEDEQDQDDPQAQMAKQQQQMAMQQEQQRAAQMQQAAAGAEVQQKVAMADKAVADAQKAQFEAEKARLELLAMQGGAMMNVGQIAPMPGMTG